MAIITASYVVRSLLDDGKGIIYTVYAGSPAVTVDNIAIEAWYFHSLHTTRPRALAVAQAILGQNLQSTHRIVGLEVGEERVSKIFRLPAETMPGQAPPDS
jgi:hypothetical protein